MLYIKLLLTITGIVYIGIYVGFNTYDLIKSVIRYTKLDVECTTLAHAISECTKLYSGIAREHMIDVYAEAYIEKSNNRLDENMVRDECVFQEVKWLFIGFMIVGFISIIWA